MENKNQKIDVKKIMNSIKQNVQTKKQQPNGIFTKYSDLKTYLKNRVLERKKSNEYEESKKYLKKDNDKDDIKFEWKDLDHNLHHTNLAVDINHVQSISSGQNKLVRWLALKVRHIIQAEIRFTLDPIVRNQTVFNSYSVGTLNQIKEGLTGISNDLSTQRNEIAKMMDTINPNLNWRYLEFENRFRGSEEEVRDRQLNYLIHIKNAKKETKAEFVLEVGCGRGEFLKILQENKIPVKGIDTNPTMVQFNVERNRPAELIDANSFLNSISDDTIIGITAFQVIEHYTPDYLLKFIQNSYKKIANGGVIILETVNPMSLFSLTHFWYDITHNRPIPPDIIKFYLEIAGFKDVNIVFSGDVPKELQLAGKDDNVKKLNQFLFGPQDYAVIAWKK